MTALHLRRCNGLTLARYCCLYLPASIIIMYSIETSFVYLFTGMLGMFLFRCVGFDEFVGRRNIIIEAF